MTNVNTGKLDSHGYHHGDLPRALVEAATMLIEEHGPEAFTLRQVARRVGVSHAAPYRHFVDKRALLAAAAELGLIQLGASTRAAFEVEEDPVEGFLALGRAYVHFAAERPMLFRIMFDPGLNDASESLTAAKEAAFAVLLGAVSEAQRAGALRDGDLIDVAVAAWSTVHGFAQLVIDRTFEERLQAVRALDEWADTITRLAFGGIGD